MSKRRSHFVHRFQTLPSALAGVPGSRRLLALAAVVLALLALTLLPTAAQAQTEVWAATMTVGELTDQAGTRYGTFGYSASAGYGSLTDTDFTRGSTTYTVRAVANNQVAGVDVTLGFVLDSALSASDVEGLVLHVGTSSFALSDALVSVLSSGDVRYYWDSSLNLSVGDTVAVRLTLLDVPPPQAHWVSNTGQTRASNAILLGNQDKTSSQGFTTGAESGGYSLGWVGVHVASENLGAGETFTVHIYTATASGARDALVYTLTSPASYTEGAVNRFTAPANATLAANTDYLVVFKGTANLVNDFQLSVTDSDAEDPGSATGWSIEDARRSTNFLVASGNSFVISVNNTAPVITSVSPVSDPGPDDTYGPGSTIEVAVVFSEAVNVTGMPRIQLRVGGSDPATQLKWANYASGTGTDTLLFTYVVQADDMDDNGIYIEANELELNSGTIQDTDGMNAVLTYPRPGTQADHKVDGSLTPPLVPTTWGLVPSGLGVGDSFRLLFIGTNGRDASSSDIAVYNTFIQNLAAAGHADIQAHSATFRMLGSTEDVDARDNTGTTGAGVPIYWLGGAKVADDYADFYDGDWDEEATGRRETGASVSIGTDWKIWTGSAEDGTEAMHTDGTSRALGNAGNQWVMQGSPNGSNSAHGPIASNTASRTTDRGLYGLSGVFTVDASLDNTAPTFLLESTTREVEENSPPGTNVGLPVTATDADDDTLTYTLEGTDAASFEIDSTSGQIQTKSGVTYDYETKEEYSVTVKADDGNGGTATIAVAIDLLDVDETVPTTWNLIPSGLGAGDRFRLLFLSSTTRNGQSTNIADYNSFVQTAAASGHADIQQYSSTFRVVGSTAAMDARDNTNTTYTAADKGVSIYWLGGTKVVDDYEDFYDGNWDDEANAKDESGNNRSVAGFNNYPITGSDHDGTEAFNPTNDSRALGASNVGAGQPNSPTGGPLRSTQVTVSNTTSRPLYGLSGVFTVDASLDVATPGAPRNVAATAGTGKVRLTWQAPESQGGGVITGYEYQRKEGTGSFGSWTTAETVAFGSNSNSAILVDATTLDDYDVKAETTYTYRVWAVNAGGGGDASAEDSATTGAAMTVKVEVAEPEVFEDEGPVRVVVVAELPATGPNTEKYDLEFSINAFTDAVTAVSFDDYGLLAISPIFTPSDFQTESGRWVARKPSTVTLVDDAVVEPDETFTVGVEKSTGTNSSHPFITVPGATDTVTVTILNDDYVPEIPAQQFEVLVGETDAGQLPAMDSRDGDTLTWTLTGGADQALFTLSTDGQLSLDTARPSLEDPGDADGDGIYELTVQASDGVNDVTGDMTVKLVDKSLPSTPTGLRWKRAGDEGGRATLTWGPPADDGNRPILRYEIQTDAGAWETVPGGGAAREITFTNLNYNQRYIYNLRAVNEVGPSAETWTENVLLRPGAPGAPGNLTAEAVSPSEIRLSWQRPSHGRDIQIVGYYFEVSLDGRDWSYSNFLLDQEYEDTFGEEGSGDDEFRLDDEEPSTRDSIGRDAARHYRVSALSVYTPALDDDDPYEDGLTRGPASEPVRATTTETPASAKASGNPLTGFELVDATAHLDAGAVEDGATLTGIDPAKVYGFRANVASGAELKSVKLELSGPGPDDRVARTENYKPYSLYGDSDGHEHGAALPTGNYTLTATAYSEKDGGGSQLGTLSIEFTVTGGPLTARFLYEEPQGYHSGSGTTLTVRLSFSEAVSTTPEALRDHALEVTNATVEAVSRVDERSDLWEVRLTPESDATVTVAVSPAADCDAAGAVCTEDGRTLASGAGTAIPGPPPNSPATGAPSISGTEQVGETLTADVTGIDDDDGLDAAVFAYQWLRGDTDIAGANGSSYTLVSEDEGRTIKVRVSFTDNAGHAETRTSDPTGAVAAKPNTKATGAPTIGGIARVGETLTADTSGIDDEDGLDTAVFTYQWVRSDGGTDTEIAGATGSSYTLTEADEGRTVKVTVSFTDAEGNAESLTSDLTGEVEAKPNTRATGAPIIDGIARVGETLTADTSGIDDDDGLDSAAFAYQWLRGDAEIAGATGETYTLTGADEGKTVKVTVSFTDAEGNPETLSSEATRVVEATETVPGRPQDLAGEASAQGIALTWTAPDGSVVTGYVVYRGKLQNGSMNGQPMTQYATIDATGADMAYTDGGVEAGAEYRYRVAAVNSAGEGKKSNWLDIAAGDSE